MSHSNRVCQIIPNPSNREGRLAQAQALSSSPTANEGVLHSFKSPEQIVWTGVDGAQEDKTPGEIIGKDISSSLSTVFYAGPRQEGEAALERWSLDCFSVLNGGLCMEDGDQALACLWSHPSKDMVLVAVLCSGDWAADLEDDLSDEFPELVQIAYSGNDNDPEVFMPDFLGDCALEHPNKKLCDIAETVLFNLLPDNQADTLALIEEDGYEEVIASFHATQSQLRKSRTAGP